MSKELADRQFEYLLNAMENAGAQDNPHEHGYGEKRKAVLDYVSALRGTEQCVVNPVMSCVCSQGTKSCTVNHGTFADGIEAAAKLCDELAELPGNSYETIQTKLCAKSIRAYGKSIRALAQDQRSEADLDIDAETSRRVKSVDRASQSSDHPSRTDSQEPGLSAEQIEHERESYKNGYGVNDARFYTLCDMALRSLTARDAGIEAAAKAVYAIRNRRFDDVVYQEAWWDACDIAEGKIRALAQGQRTSEQDADKLLREALDAYDHIVVKTGYQGDFDTSAGRAHLARKEPK